MTSAIWRIFAELNNPVISPKLADKHVIKKKKLTSIKASMFWLVCTPRIILSE